MTFLVNLILSRLEKIDMSMFEGEGGGGGEGKGWERVRIYGGGGLYWRCWGYIFRWGLIYWGTY